MMFASAAFLAGLALLTVPWWLHRLNAHPNEQRPFSSLFLMRAAQAPVHMRKRLQHLVLLTLRWLLLLAACFAFAEPALRVAGERTSADRVQPHQVIIIDRSLSMGADINGRSRFDAALAEARRLLDRLTAGQQAALVTADAELSLVLPLTADGVRLREALSTLSPGNGRLSVAGLLGRAATLAQTLAEPGEPLELVLISDFQAAGMPTQFNALIDAAALPTRLVQVDPGTVITNRAITELTPSPDGTVVVTAQSFGAPAGPVTVRLEQDGNLIGRQQIDLATDGLATASFQLPADGAHDRRRIRNLTWTASLETEDALPADNVRRLVSLETEQTPLPVLTENDRAWAYLRAGVKAAAPRFEPERISSLTGDSAHIVAVLGSEALDGGGERALERYLNDGGRVLLIVDEATRSRGVLPVVALPLAADRFQQTARGASAVDRSHPALTGFAGWQDLIFFQTLSPAADPGAEVILALDDGTPLLTEHRVGAGRLILLGTALDPAWTTLVVRPAFVSLLGNLLGYLAEDTLPAEALAGEPFAIPAQSVQLFTADGERVLGLGDTVGRPTVSLDMPGFYQLRTPARSRYLAVNVHPAESDLRVAPAGLLAEWQASIGRTAPAAPDNTTDSRAVENAGAGQLLPLAPWLLALLAVLALLEPLYANLASASHRAGPGVLTRGTPA